MSEHVTEFHNEPRSGMLWVVLLGIIGGVFLIVWAGSMVYRSAVTAYFDGLQDRFGNGYELRQLRAAEAHGLSSLHWIDRDKGTVNLPIDVAKKAVIQRYHQ